MPTDGDRRLTPNLATVPLRAAGYREFAKLSPTVPFVADDIMETFDDFSAEETLKVLGDMPRLGQVIYLMYTPST